LQLQFNFDGKNVPAVKFLNDTYRKNDWYISKPLPVTVEKIFELLKTGTFYTLSEDYEVEAIKRIIGELSEEDVWNFKNNKNFAYFNYSTYNGSERYSLTLKSENIRIEGDLYAHSPWDDFMEQFKKHFSENHIFYVYLVKKQ